MEEEKPLTHQDILSSGWEENHKAQSGHYQKSIRESVVFLRTDASFVEIWSAIKGISSVQLVTHFQGKLENRSELIKIMKKINIQ
jgi:hypothetical protein